MKYKKLYEAMEVLLQEHSDFDPTQIQIQLDDGAEFVYLAKGKHRTEGSQPRRWLKEIKNGWWEYTW